MKLVETVLRRGAFAAAVFAGIILLAMTILITWQIIQRTFFGQAFLFIDEYSGYTVLLVLALGLPLALMDDSLLLVDAVITKIGDQPRRLVQVLYDALGLCFCGIIAYELIQFTYRNYTLHIMAPTPMMTPIAVPQAVAAFGFCALVGCQAWKLIAGISALFLKPSPNQKADPK